MSHQGLRHLLTIGLVAAVLAIPATARAQYPLDVLHEFTGFASSPGPAAPLIEGRDGNLYGTTAGGGPLTNCGTIFRMTRAGEISVLHAFTCRDGAGPEALLEAADGSFYTTGSTYAADGSTPAIFKLSPAGELSAFPTLPSYSGLSRLVQGADGNVYGTIKYGGAGGGGLVFRMTPSGVFAVLHEFSSAFAEPGTNVSEASRPVGIIQGADGNFYGTTAEGGTTGCGVSPYCNVFGNGTVFRMSPGGTVTVLHKFNGGTEGAEPESGLTQGTDGNFYGTTSMVSSDSRAGTVFRITPAGTLTTVHVFPPNEAGYNFGATPLVLGADGNLYGTAPDGGVESTGTIFRLTPQGRLTVLHQFENAGGGIHPIGVVQASDGRFYGTTLGGGIANRGTAFVMDLAGTTTTLYRFPGSREGAHPEAPLVQASDGNFYGTTSYGGLYNFGTIFRVTPSGGFSVVYAFSGAFDGGHPESALVQGRDGHLYGTTPSQGAYNEGVMFRVTLDGRFTTLHAFNSALDGARPGGLTLGADGNFFGMTRRAGASNHGTVYRAAADGQVTVLHAFGYPDEVEGYLHPPGVIQASDGHLYGATRSAAFRITTSGSFTVISNLEALNTSFDEPLLLAQGADGQLYGATLCIGQLFRMSLSGVVTVLAPTGTGCPSEGPTPAVSLTAGVDGTIYGTLTGILVAGFPDFPPVNPTPAGAVVFRINPAGAVTVLHAFDSPFIPEPRGVIQAADGNLYGTTYRGGYFGSGIVFRVSLHRPLAPTAVVATPAGPNQATLRWNAVAGAASYIIRRVVPGQAPTVIASGLRATSLTVPLVASNANASYTVTAVNADGESVGSAPINLPWGSPASRTPTITTVHDYDGDGKADFTVYRSATGQWLTLKSSNTGLARVAWGAPALLDRPVAADYDGDGKADVAVYRETSGEWFVHRSSDGALSQTTWGFPTAGDLPVPADYDGDGRADLAVFRATTGEWFIHRSSDGTLMQLAWGSPALGDLPVPADYDGDGRTDIAVYRGTTGEWFVHQSSNGAFVKIAWGSPAFGDVPVPADYDGDGRTDAAVYRSTTAEWFIAYAAGGTAGYAWGSPALDVPVVADYDGDGRADVAVYRFSTGEWFVRRNGQQPVAFGAPFLGDAVRKY